jgi:hypothetical protein
MTIDEVSKFLNISRAEAERLTIRRRTARDQEVINALISCSNSQSPATSVRKRASSLSESPWEVVQSGRHLRRGVVDGTISLDAAKASLSVVESGA